MTILILVILYSQVVSGTPNYPTVWKQEVVASPEAAAIILYERTIEPDKAHLYKMDIVNLSVVEIDIPKVSFTPAYHTEPAECWGEVEIRGSVDGCLLQSGTSANVGGQP